MSTGSLFSEICFERAVNWIKNWSELNSCSLTINVLVVTVLSTNTSPAGKSSGEISGTGGSVFNSFSWVLKNKLLSLSNLS